MFIEKLSKSLSDYKQQLKYKHKQLSLKDLVKHIIIIIENTNRKQAVADKGKKIATRANLVEDNKRQNNSNNKYGKRIIISSKPTTKPFKVNLTQAKVDDTIAAVVSQVNLVANVKIRC
ncbi:hypothetical protein A4A49_55219 [Nicotiana attenuata]|uniref:Uncharacterized protein n=1 Tax=Nicotiana attenuata TaxID=49451 RepID=A0A1J6JNA8_NICAT|nr:hypothetical protein A4A49_55219 [Nicotiana attenuata]